MSGYNKQQGSFLSTWSRGHQHNCMTFYYAADFGFKSIQTDVSTTHLAHEIKHIVENGRFGVTVWLDTFIFSPAT